MDKSNTVKLFVGNLALDTTQEELSAIFEPYGQVVSCSVLRQFAFVHLQGEGAAERAIRELNGREFRGRNLVVEESRGRPLHSTKVFVGNLSGMCTTEDLQQLFQTFGKVLECDKVKGIPLLQATPLSTWKTRKMHSKLSRPCMAPHLRVAPYPWSFPRSNPANRHLQGKSPVLTVESRATMLENALWGSRLWSSTRVRQRSWPPPPLQPPAFHYRSNKAFTIQSTTPPRLIPHTQLSLGSPQAHALMETQ
ncbi:RNA-binding protein 14b isoform X3 [Scomber scombrus]|uniref:RNA-binding protein 14b isoform X3 n=1 Tax=Scomber scombrus TaxID=13677 RepID=UPI002DD98E28|nr:RNA-binding protein 14b isoform X3 [Scomber scombrus]